MKFMDDDDDDDDELSIAVTFCQHTGYRVSARLSARNIGEHLTQHVAGLSKFCHIFIFLIVKFDIYSYIPSPKSDPIPNHITLTLTYAKLIYTVFQKSDAKIQITITTAYLIRIKCHLSGFNYHLSDVNVANFSKIHRTVSEQQLF